MVLVDVGNLNQLEYIRILGENKVETNHFRFPGAVRTTQ